MKVSHLHFNLAPDACGFACGLPPTRCPGRAPGVAGIADAAALGGNDRFLAAGFLASCCALAAGSCRDGARQCRRCGGSHVSQGRWQLSALASAAAASPSSSSRSPATTRRCIDSSEAADEFVGGSSVGSRFKPNAFLAWVQEDAAPAEALPVQPRSYKVPENVAKIIQTTLKEDFNIPAFRSDQEDVITAIIENRDVCVFWATGKGKSLCYQLPAVALRKTVIVVSPLISLMMNQVNEFNEHFRRSHLHGEDAPQACMLGGGQPDPRVEEDAANGKYTLVYVSPEKLTQGDILDEFRALYERGGIAFAAIDEAHCISQWGNDFRVAYRDLYFVREAFPSLPLMALTATSTPVVQDDVSEYLRLREPLISLTTKDRPNLLITRRRKLQQEVADMNRIAREIAETGGSTMIFVKKRIDADRIAMILQAKLAKSNIQVCSYHAEKPKKDREQAQSLFLRNQALVMVATVSFGMGINKPDVRRVIHYGAPTTVEDYHQQIGRSGRDGKPAVCELITEDQDFESNPMLEGIEDWEVLSSESLRDFACGCSCARKGLVACFQEEPEFGERCGECDFCRSTSSEDGRILEQRNFRTEALPLLRAVAVCEECAYPVPAVRLINIVIGKWTPTPKDVKRYRHCGRILVEMENIRVLLAEVAGPAAKNPAKYYRQLLPVLCARGFLERRIQRRKLLTGSTYRLTSLSRAVLDEGLPVTMHIPVSMRQLFEQGGEGHSPEAGQATQLEVEDVQMLTVSDLKRELKARGLPTSGLKAALVERLQQVLLPDIDRSRATSRIMENVGLLPDVLVTRLGSLSPAEFREAIERALAKSLGRNV
eukprot:TRINITY_DN59750_c0_g2_i1.p1 TRINITY_DN59750_c0_g2~~TRINITY_DN59750_c0_g2_i1.p1  ORF type:complete len:828 (-),score=167.23 TRINITY_DN59750_c0_g2_i1:66-2549(-)